MFRAVFKYELSHWAKSWNSYIFLACFFGIPFLLTLGYAGIFGPGSVDPGSVANSPLSIFSLLKYLSKMLYFVVPAIVGHSLYREFKNEAHSILFTYPIGKKDFFGAKFLSSFAIVALLGLCILLAVSIAASLPWVMDEHVLPFDLSTYLIQYFFQSSPGGPVFRKREMLSR